MMTDFGMLPQDLKARLRDTPCMLGVRDLADGAQQQQQEGARDKTVKYVCAMIASLSFSFLFLPSLCAFLSSPFPPLFLSLFSLLPSSRSSLVPSLISVVSFFFLVN